MPTLHCQIGNHDWERPSQRGRKPLSCPQCVGIAPSAGSVKAPTVTVQTALCERAMDRIDSLYGEAPRQVEYILTQLLERNRDPEDVSILEKRLTDLIR
jgi:hypothetical protein